MVVDFRCLDNLLGLLRVIGLESLINKRMYRNSEATVLIRIYGKVTDFNGNPMERVEIVVLSREFKAIYQTFSDADGKYSLDISRGNYIALWACKDYAIKNLEYWAWNIPAYQDLEINPRINGLEVYAINAWIPQGGLPSMQIYFRPMSLERAKEFSQRLGIGFPPITR
jgi:hypothetical protein